MKPTEALHVLGLRPGASARQLRSRYRRLAFDLHPDRNPNDPASFERFKCVQQAYRIARRHASANGGATGRCAGCGRHRVLTTGLDRRRYCRLCVLRGARWRSLPAPPVVIASCAFAIAAMVVATVCLVLQVTTGSRAFGWAALAASVSMLIFLAVISIRVGYCTAEPGRRRAHRTASTR